MRTLLILVAMGATVFGTGCTSTSTNPVATVGCTLETTINGIVALGIASELQCSNQAAIVTTIQSAESSLNICSSPAAVSIGKPKPKPVLGPDGKTLLPLKSVGGDICSSVGTALVGSLANGVVPAAWGCTSATASASLSALITTACNKAFP